MLLIGGGPSFVARIVMAGAVLAALAGLSWKLQDYGKTQEQLEVAVEANEANREELALTLDQVDRIRQDYELGLIRREDLHAELDAVVDRIWRIEMQCLDEPIPWPQVEE